MKTRALKALLLLCCAIVSGCQSHRADSPETNFQARYDLVLRDGDLKSTFKSVAFLDANAKTAFGITPHFLELRLQPISDSEYEIRVTVAPTKEAPRQVRLNKTFRGQYGVPLEMVSNAEQLRLDGTLAILRSR
jgi:hypothetical protein